MFLEDIAILDLLLVRAPCDFLVHPLPHLRPLQLRRHLVVEDKDVSMLLKVTIDILKRAVRRLRIEKVRRRYEAGADDGPDDPEPVAQVRYSRRCDLRDLYSRRKDGPYVSISLV